jgi:hypothetical protein
VKHAFERPRDNRMKQVRRAPVDGEAPHPAKDEHDSGPQQHRA